MIFRAVWDGGLPPGVYDILWRVGASYRFKPIKKRQVVITLLHQCWDSKNLGADFALYQPISTTAGSTFSEGKDKFLCSGASVVE